jgi:hypothetical protein
VVHRSCHFLWCNNTFSIYLYIDFEPEGPRYIYIYIRLTRRAS